MTEEKRKAEQRKKATLPKKGQKGFQCEGKFPPYKKGKSRDVLGGYVGLSGRTLQKAKKVVAAQKVKEKLKRRKREAAFERAMNKNLNLDIKTNTHFLYELEIRSAMSQAAFDMASKRRPSDYVV